MAVKITPTVFVAAPIAVNDVVPTLVIIYVVPTTKEPALTVAIFSAVAVVIFDVVAAFAATCLTANVILSVPITGQLTLDGDHIVILLTVPSRIKIKSGVEGVIKTRPDAETSKSVSVVKTARFAVAEDRVAAATSIVSTTNVVVLGTECTAYCPLYPDGVTPAITIASPTEKPCAALVVNCAYPSDGVTGVTAEILAYDAGIPDQRAGVSLTI